MINIDSLYAVSTPILGLGSAILTVFTFIDPQIIPATAGGTDISPIALIISLIGTFLLGLMRITNSVKNVEDTNKEILATLKTSLETSNKVLGTQNDLLKSYLDDSKKQDKLLESTNKLLEIENKNMDLANKTLNTMNRIVSTKKDIKKSGNSGTNYPIHR